MTPWYAWRNRSPCVIRWWKGKATSVQWMEIRQPPIVTPKPRLARVSNALLEDLDKATVDFRPNYDGNEIEPDVLPTRIPNLLVNGSDGIAVGMATKIPPHNLTEIVDATITLVNNPAAQLAELLKFVQGPDFPTAGIIHGRAGIVDAYKDRTRPLHHARQGGHRNFQQRSQGDRHYRNSLPGQQGAPGGAHRATGQRQDR